MLKMKKAMVVLVVMLVWLVSQSVVADDLQLLFVDAIGTDTAADSIRADTAYSPAFDISKYQTLEFGVKVAAHINGRFTDTNWTADTFFVYFQRSFDKETWTAPWKIDTVLNNQALVFDEFIQNRDTIPFGDWGRLMFIHWDSVEADMPDALNRTYYKQVNLYLGGKKK